METQTIQPNELQEKLAVNNERKRILLVDGNIPVDDRGTNYQFGTKKFSGITPFGLNRIKSYLDSRGIPCDVKHIQETSLEEISHYDAVGISALSPSIPSVFEFTKAVKQMYPQIPVIGGGEHFGLDSEWILKNQGITGIDACCTMQGELPLLALGLGSSLSEIGSIAYNQDGNVIVNPKYPRLTEQHGLENILAPSPVVNSQLEPIPMPELAAFFKGSASTQTSSGCNHACTFCTNGPFYGKAVSTIETAKKEVESAQKAGADFLFVRNAMLNVSSDHLEDFKKYMQQVNSGENKMAWYSFMSATPNKTDFEGLARAGSLMIGVGIEDVIGDRKQVGKGGSLDIATKFIDDAKEHMIVRALLILGLPNHYDVPKAEIKQKMLDYMTAHPQAAYRINILTPTPGTMDYKNYADTMIDDPHKNIAFLRKLDTLHSVVDPKKMREKLGNSQLNTDSRYVQTPQDWEDLRVEITSEYLSSREHAQFVKSLKGKEFLGKKDLLYDIAKKFIEVNHA